MGWRDKLYNMFNFKSIIDNLKGYVETRIQILVLEMQKKAAAVVTNFIHFFLLISTIGMILLFLSFGLALYLNQVLCSRFLGFFLVSIIYLIAFIFVASRGDKRLINRIVQRLMHETGETGDKDEQKDQ